MDTFQRGFLQDRQSQGATKGTLNTHRQCLHKFNQYLSDTEQSTDVTTWSRYSLRGFIVWLQETPTKRTGKPLNAFSVRGHVNSVWAYCRWLYQEELIETDITIKAAKPKLPDDQKTPFTDNDLIAMIAASKRTRMAERDYAIILTLLDTGLRASELCNLSVGDFLQSDMRLLVRRGKGQKDRATPISHKTAIALQKYLTRKRGNPTDKSVPLFTNQKGHRLTRTGLLQLIYRLADDAGVENAHPHRFRHTAAILLLRNGGDVFTVQSILGHSDLNMTRKYVNLLTEDLARVHAVASPVANLKR